jgi:pimeloyl-ACP methyl ester carboxylesterase
VDGSGSFTLAGGAGREGKTIEVYYHKPRTFTAQSPVLMVVPGAGRNGWTYRDAWVNASEEHGVLILSPSYSEEHYPEFWSYNLAGMISDVDVGQTPVSYRIVSDPGAWIFNDFDRLFLAVKDYLGFEASVYDAFGHSAGGQLLHRLALFHPGSMVNRILAANSGWYTVPTFDDEFPYGLMNSSLTPATIEAAFAEDLVVFLGERDDENEVRGDLARTPEIDIQGISRIERGKYFYDRAARTAAELGLELKWQLEIVPGVGHDTQLMSAAAAAYLY